MIPKVEIYDGNKITTLVLKNLTNGNLVAVDLKEFSNRITLNARHNTRRQEEFEFQLNEDIYLIKEQLAKVIVNHITVRVEDDVRMNNKVISAHIDFLVADQADIKKLKSEVYSLNVANSSLRKRSMKLESQLDEVINSPNFTTVKLITCNYLKNIWRKLWKKIRSVQDL